MPQPPKRRSPRKTTARTKPGRSASTRRSPATTRRTPPGYGEVLDLPALLARNPSALAIGGILLGAVTRRRWIFLSSLAAWLLLQDRKRAG